MAFTPKEIEYLHDTGEMPDWIYYQQNGKTAQENYRRLKMSRHKKNESFIMSFIQGMLHETMKAALNEIFKELRFDK